MTERKLTQEEKNEIAELAADKAYDRFYLAVGKSVTKKLISELAVLIVALNRLFV